MSIQSYAILEQGKPLEPFEFEPGDLSPDQVDIQVTSCGLCHSDLSMAQNDWHITRYPFVGGHEVVGKVAAVGDQVPNLQVGDTVGLGWFSDSCMHCGPCLDGDHNHCRTREQTIVGRFGGFADTVRCHWVWATPLPSGFNFNEAGPLFCGGITVFNPIIQCGVQPTMRVGVVGIGGLGHLALQFLNKWGCEVVAFTSSESKKEEALKMGAHHTVNSRDDQDLKNIAGSLDFILVTANADLNWDAYFQALAPKGRLHVVGAVPNPIPSQAFVLLANQYTLSGTPLGSPATNRRMLDFCARHDILPVTEHFPFSRINDAFEHLKSGKARYRIVLDADWA